VDALNALPVQCPLWVISGHLQCKKAVQLGMSALCHKHTFAPHNYSSMRVALKCEIAAINNRSVVIAETKQ
jgi:hypothetical protein